MNSELEEPKVDFDEDKVNQGVPTLHELRRRLRLLSADLNLLNKTLYHRRPLVIKEAMSVLGTPCTSTTS